MQNLTKSIKNVKFVKKYFDKNFLPFFLDSTLILNPSLIKVHESESLHLKIILAKSLFLRFIQVLSVETDLDGLIMKGNNKRLWTRETIRGIRISPLLVEILPVFHDWLT